MGQGDRGQGSTAQGSTAQGSTTQVIVGAGTIGTALARRLAADGRTVKLVSRRGTGPDVAGVEAVAADATDGAALAAVCRGAGVVYNCANPSSYAKWATQWPPMATAILAAAESAGAVLVTLSNLYGYGPPTGPMTEDLPLAAPGRKGRIRAEMWADALAAHRAGRVRVTEARASDYFGPGFTDTAHMGSRVVPRVLKGKTVHTIGHPDVAHSWSYVDDVVETLVALGREPSAWGRAWHVPSGEPHTQRQMVEAFAAAAGVAAPAVAGIPGLVLRAAGVVSPLIRELGEVRYQFDRPFVLDATDAETAFGLRATDFDEAVAATVAWWRRRATADTAAGAPTRAAAGKAPGTATAA